MHVFIASRATMNSVLFIRRWHALQLVRRSTLTSPRTGFNSVCIREENGTPCQQQNCVRWCHHLSHVLPVGVLIRPDVFNGYGYFYVRLYCTCLEFQANTVEEYVLLSALLHIFVGLKRTWDQKLSSGLKLLFLVSNWSRTFRRSPEQRVFPYLCIGLLVGRYCVWPPLPLGISVDTGTLERVANWSPDSLATVDPCDPGTEGTALLQVSPFGSIFFNIVLHGNVLEAVVVRRNLLYSLAEVSWLPRPTACRRAEGMLSVARFCVCSVGLSFVLALALCFVLCLRFPLQFTNILHAPCFR